MKSGSRPHPPVPKFTAGSADSARHDLEGAPVTPDKASGATSAREARRRSIIQRQAIRSRARRSASNTSISESEGDNLQPLPLASPPAAAASGGAGSMSSSKHGLRPRRSSSLRVGSPHRSATASPRVSPGGTPTSSLSRSNSRRGSRSATPRKGKSPLQPPLSLSPRPSLEQLQMEQLTQFQYNSPPRTRRTSSAHSSPHGSRRSSVAGSRRGSAHASPAISRRASAHGSVTGSRRASAYGSPPLSRRGSAHGSLAGSRRGSAHGSLAGSRRGSVRASLQDSFAAAGSTPTATSRRRSVSASPHRAGRRAPRGAIVGCGPLAPLSASSPSPLPSSSSLSSSPSIARTTIPPVESPTAAAARARMRLGSPLSSPVNHGSDAITRQLSNISSSSVSSISSSSSMNNNSNNRSRRRVSPRPPVGPRPNTTASVSPRPGAIVTSSSPLQLARFNSSVVRPVAATPSASATGAERLLHPTATPRALRVDVSSEEGEIVFVRSESGNSAFGGGGSMSGKSTPIRTRRRAAAFSSTAASPKAGLVSGQATPKANVHTPHRSPAATPHQSRRSSASHNSSNISSNLRTGADNSRNNQRGGVFVPRTATPPLQQQQRQFVRRKATWTYERNDTTTTADKTSSHDLASAAAVVAGAGKGPGSQPVLAHHGRHLSVSGPRKPLPPGAPPAAAAAAAAAAGSVVASVSDGAETTDDDDGNDSDRPCAALRIRVPVVMHSPVAVDADNNSNFSDSSSNSDSGGPALRLNIEPGADKCETPNAQMERARAEWNRRRNNNISNSTSNLSLGDMSEDSSCSSDGRPDRLVLSGLDSNSLGISTSNNDGKTVPDMSRRGSYFRTIDSYEVTQGGTLRAGEFEINMRGARIGGKQKGLTLGHAISPSEIVVLGELGRGACAPVMKALWLPEMRVVALKSVAMYGEATKRRQVLHELESFRGANNAAILQMIGAYYVSETERLTMVLEYMSAGSLADAVKGLGPLSPSVLRHVFAQLAAGLKFLHGRYQLHRDIKPDNLLLSRVGYAKISDFGLTRQLDDTNALCNTFVGTMVYLSPERAAGQEFSYPSDVWSLGVSLVYCGTGKLPAAQDIWALVENSDPPSLDRES